MGQRRTPWWWTMLGIFPGAACDSSIGHHARVSYEDSAWTNYSRNLGWICHLPDAPSPHLLVPVFSLPSSLRWHHLCPGSPIRQPATRARLWKAPSAAQFWSSFASPKILGKTVILVLQEQLLTINRTTPSATHFDSVPQTRLPNNYGQGLPHSNSENLGRKRLIGLQIAPSHNCQPSSPVEDIKLLVKRYISTSR